ncbi:prokaryotic type I DNA topoisomerase [Neocallimastix californiae]|uniref:DNA topoisomerase n=1 Tax=Neocallimastix californiae TaxID=1754190 RepID=A0A1Y1ZCM6_9FUNG|nr:prokaryotic type I DNA topoisomerase [Neocallimastix californiae]|eukprot:ORY07565.1 prokaryotic type I DNA topoisomerase [Neocallimastix californiae]
MKVLCVAEKPSIAKGITTILSNGRWEARRNRRDGMINYCFPYNLNGENCDMVVTAVAGHLMSYDFTPQYNSWYSCPPSKLFEAPIIRNIYKNAKSIAENLRKESRDAQKLIIWTDCDREGENIGSEISDVCKENNRYIDVYRARFSVVQDREIRNACRRLVRLDEKQIDAVNVRIELDLRIGASFTRFQTLNFTKLFNDLKGKVISFGTCQFPTLGFVVERYLQIQNFVSEDFWKIEVSHERNNGSVSFVWKRDKLFDRFICFIYYEKCMKNCLAKVISMTQKPKSKWKPLPLTTIDLIKLGSKFLKISSDEIMKIAEQLYNQGYISYPRTETDQFKDDFDLNSLIQIQTNSNTWGNYAQSLLQGKFVKPRKGKNNDQAHPPIHPTKALPDSASVKEKKVYEFIVRRFLACCSDDAKGSETVVTINIADEIFTANGLMIIEENYLKIYVYEKWGEKSIPLYQEGETFIPTKMQMTAGKTTPPKPLTEPDLIGLMDKNGIGTDATIHEHIKKIKDREYIYEERHYLYPTTLGVALIEGYNSVESNVSLTKPNLRKMLEESLQNICKGQQNKNDVLRNDLTLYKNMFEKINREEKKISQSKYQNKEIIVPCPLCDEFITLYHISNDNILIGK